MLPTAILKQIPCAFPLAVAPMLFPAAIECENIAQKSSDPLTNKTSLITTQLMSVD